MTKDKTTRKQVSHFSIFDYWKDKKILDNGEIVGKDTTPNQDYEWVVWSDAEPSCWGCGLPVITKIEEESRPINECDIPLIWNDRNVKSALNRCHIVPHALGGSDTPDNLFLMCERCHCESPDTTNRHTFFRWVYRQRKTYSLGYLSSKAAYELLEDEIKRRGLDISPVDVVTMICVTNPDFNTSSLNEYIYKNVCSHGVATNRNSLVSGVVDWLLHNYVEACLEG